MKLSSTNLSYYYVILFNKSQNWWLWARSASDQLYVAIEPFVVLDLNLKNLNTLQEVEGVKLRSPFHPSPHYSPLFQTHCFQQSQILPGPEGI